MRINSLIYYIVFLLFAFGSCILPGCTEPASTAITSTITPETTTPVEQQEVHALKVGDTAPLFILNDIYGENVSLSNFSGKKVIINMWILGCHGCIDEMPVLQEFYQKWSGEGIVLIGINTTNSLYLVKSFAASNGLDFTLLVDSANKLNRSYSITGFPTTFFIDGDGVIRAIKDGMFESMEEIEELYNSY
jgi:peroxiredoxin